MNENAYKLCHLAGLLLHCKSTLEVMLMFIKLDKTTREIFDFVHILTIFLSLINLTQKTIMYVQIVHIPNDCSATGHLIFVVWGSVQATTGELQPQNLLKTVSKEGSHALSSTYGASVCLFWLWHV